MAMELLSAAPAGPFPTGSREIEMSIAETTEPDHHPPLSRSVRWISALGIVIDWFYRTPNPQVRSYFDRKSLEDSDLFFRKDGSYLRVVKENRKTSR
jgi:hypothetical protein